MIQPSTKAKIIIGNSFCELKGFPKDIMDAISKDLSYRNEETQFERKRIYSEMERAKRYKNHKYFFALKKRLSELPQDVVCLLNENNTFMAGLLYRVKNTLKTHKFDLYEEINTRVRPNPYLTLKWRNKPPALRYYQEEILEQTDKYSKGVISASVASGKTRCIVELIKQKEVNTLVIVPSLALLQQIYDELFLAFGPKVKMVRTAGLKTKNKLPPIRIVNIQTLVSLQKKGHLDKLISDVDMVIADEIHHWGAFTATELAKDFNNIYYKYGFSGTFLRNDSRILELHGFISNVIYEYPPKKAVEDGFITPTEYIICKVPGRAHPNYQREYDLNYCGGMVLLNTIADIVKTIPMGEQILILVDRKDKAGNLISDWLTDMGYANKYISGDDKKEAIKEAIDGFNELKYNILIGTTVIGEGIDIRSTKHLIIGGGGKSEIKLVQSVGRAVRLYPGKEKAYIYDFDFLNTRFLGQHLRKRVMIYKDHFAGEVREYEL